MTLLSPRDMVRRYREWRGRQACRARRRWWDGRSGRDGHVDWEIQPGVRLALHYDSELCRLIHAGYYEIDERHFVNAFLREGDHFVDIGANVGLYSVIAGTIVGKGGSVHAFEPVAGTFARLEDNVRRNGLGGVVGIHCLAMSSSKGRMPMASGGVGRDAWSSLARGAEGGAVEEIAADTWDGFSAEHHLPTPTLMKVDIEGWESEFLEGASRALARDAAPPIVIELNEAAARAAGGSSRALVAKLEDLGYRLHTYDRMEFALRPLPRREAYDQNAIAVKDVDAVRERLAQRINPEWMH